MDCDYILQYPPLVRAVRDVGRNFDKENNSDLTERNKEGYINVVKRLQLLEKSSQVKTVKSEMPLAGLNPQSKDLKMENFKRQTQLSLTSSGYSSSASRYSRKFSNDYAGNTSHLSKDICVMNIVSLQQCPRALSAKSLPKPQIDAVGSCKEVRRINIVTQMLSQSLGELCFPFL